MGRKLKSAQFTFETLPSRDPAPAPPAPPAPPAAPGTDRIEEFRGADGELWRVSRFDLLAAEFPEITLAELPRFAEQVSRDARRWLVARRLFGIAPIIPPAESDPEDLRTWSRDELAAKLGLTRPQLQTELDAVRGMLAAPAATDPEPEKPAPTFDANGVGELVVSDAALLEQHGFPEDKFHQPGRGSAEERAERAWFCSRLREWSKLLEDRNAGQLARAALDNELQMRRAEAELSRKHFGTDGYRDILRLKNSIEERYQEQLIKLDEVAPYIGAASGRQSFVGTVADLTRAYQEYYATGSNRLADGIFAATEIQVLMRRSVQAPEPQYRCGLVVYLNAAKAHLWDPAWRGQFSSAQLKKLDEAWRAAAVAAGEADRLPDLESEDPVLGEYEGLHLPAE